VSRSYTGVARLILDNGRDMGDIEVQIFDGGRRGWEGTMWTILRHVLEATPGTDMLPALVRLPGGRQGRILIHRATLAEGRTISFVGQGESPLAIEVR
jgi:hypothetical protein